VIDVARTVRWLLDPVHPAVRAATLRRLYGLGRNNRRLRELQRRAFESSEAASLFARQAQDGSWHGPRLYTPKHSSTFWTLKLLGDWGLDRSFEQVERAAEFAFQFQGRDGEFYQMRRASGGPPLRLLPVPCVTSRAACYLVRLGYAGDERVRRAVGHLEGRQRLDGGWSCTGNSEPAGTETERPCTSMTVSFLLLAEALREEGFAEVVTPDAHGRALQCALRDFAKRMEGLADGRGADADWMLLEHPVFTHDLADALRLFAPGARTDVDRAAVDRAVEALIEKADGLGRWPLERSPRRPPVPSGPKDRPNRWVTLRAVEALVRAGRLDIPPLRSVDPG